MESQSRTIRFKSAEIKMIEEFLSKNSFFDFSSLTRLAVLEFIKRPALRLVAIEEKAENSDLSQMGVDRGH